MKQLALATLQYANDNKGAIPSRGGNNSDAMANLNGGNFTQGQSSTWDWIAWLRKVDPVNGQSNTGHDTNITNSALAKYMSVKEIVTNTPEESNRAALALQSVYRCPSDRIEARPNVGAGKPVYRYSYSMNDFYAVDGTKGVIDPVAGLPSKGLRYDGTFNGKINSIHKPSEKLLFVDEDENTIDDGVYRGNAANWVSQQSVNTIASRHELKKRQTSGATTGLRATENARGNVTFWDGHGEFMTRKEAVSQRYTGNYFPDPSGF